MQYNTISTYPFTAEYWSTTNTATQGTTPIWEDEYIKTLDVQFSASTTLIRVMMTVKEPLAIGYIIKNIKDANGVLLFNDNPQNPNPVISVDTRQYRINSCDPKMNAYGFNEAFLCQLQQLNILRVA